MEGRLYATGKEKMVKEQNENKKRRLNYKTLLFLRPTVAAKRERGRAGSDALWNNGREEGTGAATGQDMPAKACAG